MGLNYYLQRFGSPRGELKAQPGFFQRKAMGDHVADLHSARGDEVHSGCEVAGGGGVGGGEGGSVSEEDVVDGHRDLDARLGGGVEKHSTVAVHRFQRLEQRGTGTGGDDDEIGQAAVIDLAETFGGVMVGAEGGVGTEPFGRFEAEIRQIGRDDAPRSQGPGQVNVKHTGQPAAQHQHRLSRLDIGAALTPVHACQRLGNRGLGQGNAIRNWNRAPIDIDGGEADVLAESAGIVVGGTQGVADGVAAAEAIAAGVAGYVMGDDEPVVLTELGDIAPDLHDRARDLVSQHQGSALDPVPLHDVAATDAAGVDPEQQLTGPDLRTRHLLDADVVVVVVHRYAHVGLPAPVCWRYWMILIAGTSPSPLKGEGTCWVGTRGAFS